MARRRGQTAGGERYTFGANFQRLIARCCLRTDFLRRNREMIEPGFFAYEALRLIVRTALRAFDGAGDAPSITAIRQTLHERGELGPDVTEALDELRATPVSRADKLSVEARIVRFAEHARLEHRLTGAVDALRDGDDALARARLEDALAGPRARMGVYDYGESVVERAKSYTNGSKIRRPVPTGFPSIDDALDGGLGAGELGFAIAATGVGKSTLLVNFGYAALAAGAVVAHYSLEMSREMLARRYDMRITGLTKTELAMPDIRLDERLREAVEWQKAKLLIREHPMRSLTPSQLRASVLVLPQRPGVLLVDYADVLRPPRKRDTQWQEAAEIYEELKRVAQELDVPIWTACQGNRTAYARRRRDTKMGRTIDLDDIAEAYMKSTPADVVLTLNVSADNLDEIWLHVAKVREGTSAFDVQLVKMYHRMMLKEKEADDEEARAEARTERRRRTAT